jgi:hypothetical protein
MVRSLSAVALALGAFLTTVPVASAKAPRPLPSLLARVTVPTTGAKVAKRVRLNLLDPSAFRVLSRPSAASVTLGWPAAHPCAQTTLRLAILPGASDADAAAHAVIPAPDRQGTASWTGNAGAGGTRPTYNGTWLAHTDILNNTKLQVAAVADKPLLDDYGAAVGGLLQLRLDGHTTTSPSQCAGANRFQLGPNLLETIITAAS